MNESSNIIRRISTTSLLVPTDKWPLLEACRLYSNCLRETFNNNDMIIIFHSFATSFFI